MGAIERITIKAFDELSNKLNELNFKHTKDDLMFIVKYFYNKEFGHGRHKLNYFHYVDSIKSNKKFLFDVMHEIQCYNMLKEI